MTSGLLVAVGGWERGVVDGEPFDRSSYKMENGGGKFNRKLNIVQIYCKCVPVTFIQLLAQHDKFDHIKGPFRPVYSRGT